MIGYFLRNNRQAWPAIVGIGCALIVLELQRMPAVLTVSFTMFAPAPYFAEVAAVLLVALLYRCKSGLRLSDSFLVRVVIGAAVTGFSFLVMSDMPGKEGVAFAVEALYRISSAFLLLAWGERILLLGARRAALTFAFALVFSGILSVLLSFFDRPVAHIVLFLIPLVSGVCFLIFRPTPLSEKQKDESRGKTFQAEFQKILPRFSCLTRKEKLLICGLVALPLLCRAPVVSIQSSWMSLQDSPLVAFLIQLSIGSGVVLAGFLCLLVIKYAWNRNFILVYELFVLPVTFLAFYASQASADLWFIYLLIIDATYKITLFFLFATPFLISGSKNQLLPLLLSFAFMIFSRAFLSALYLALPASVFVVVSTTVVLIAFVGGGVLAFFLMQKSASVFSADLDAGEKGSNQSLFIACDKLAEQYGLTPREKEILLLLAQKYRAPYIAKKLVVSPATVKTHMRNLYAKLDIHSQTDLHILLEEDAH